MPTRFIVKKHKKGNEGENFWKEVGNCFIDTEDGTGSLYLHMFDGSFRLFSEAYYERRAKEKESEK